MQSEDVRKGLNFLAMFSPPQVRCIMAAVSANGGRLPTAVEEHQVEVSYPNNPLGMMDPEALTSSEIADLARTFGLIVRDALVSEWTVEEYTKMIAQSTGIGNNAARDMAEKVVTNDTADLTKFLTTNPLIDNITFGALPILANAIDDIIDDYSGKTTQDNLYEFLLCGRQIKEAILRGKLMGLEKRAELQGAARVDHAQLVRSTTLPDAVRSTLDAFLTVKKFQQDGKTETGEPYPIEQGEQDSKALADALYEGLALMQRSAAADPEQGGWLGDILGFVGKGASKLVKGISSAVKRRRASRAGTSGSTIKTLGPEYRRVRRARSSAPASRKDFEILITAK